MWVKAVPGADLKVERVTKKPAGIKTPAGSDVMVLG